MDLPRKPICKIHCKLHVTPLIMSVRKKIEKFVKLISRTKNSWKIFFSKNHFKIHYYLIIIYFGSTGGIRSRTIRQILWYLVTGRHYVHFVRSHISNFPRNLLESQIQIFFSGCVVSRHFTVTTVWPFRREWNKELGQDDMNFPIRNGLR